MTKRLQISRRNFIKYSAAGATLLLSGCSSKENGSTVKKAIHSQPLPIPELLTGTKVGDQIVYDLTMQCGSMNYFPGKKTATFAYNEHILGPTLLMNKGDNVVINVTNQLGEATTTHWHGLHLPAVMDGGPQQRIEHGETWKAHFTIMNEAATFWYHPHLLHKTATQVYHGLAGLLLIKDPKYKLNLPDQYGIDDIPLIVQDKDFKDDGSFHYSGEEMGVKGNNILVNGAITPVLNAPAQWIRFRILNGSNARIYNFGFSDDRKFYQVGTDGGLLEKPVPLTRLMLSTGERAEILVDFSGQKDSQVRLVSYSSEMENLNPFWASHALDKTTFDIMSINVIAAVEKAITALPISLVSINRLDASQVNKTRFLNLEMNFFGPMTINGKSMDMKRIDQTIKLNDIEVWEVTNESDLAHPFHIHDIQFLILTRDGLPPPDNEKGWKDVVLVRPNETVKLIMQFTEFADPDAAYMYHCHILEHEDAGMMGQFVVV